MKTFFVSICLFFCLYSYCQDTMVGKKVMFNRFGYTVLEQYHKSKSSVENGYGIMWAIITLDKSAESQYDYQYILVNEKKDTAQVNRFQFYGKLKKGLLFFEDQFYAYLEKYHHDRLAMLVASQIELGFTEEEVGIAFGKPDEIQSIKSSTLDRSTWIYGNLVYLYFENGKLVSMGN